MTRTVEDCAIMLQAIAGYDPLDSGSVPEAVPDYMDGLDSAVRGLRLGVEREYFFYPGVAPDVRALVESAIAELEEQGATLREVSMPHLELMGPTGLTILLGESSNVHRRLIRTRGADYDPATRVMLELGEFVPATHYLQAQRCRALLRSVLRQTFTANGLDAMIWPTLPVITVPTAELSQPRADGCEGTPITAFIHHTFSANVVGQPALSVPCGLSATGMPVGFQLLGRPFDERGLFQIARAYERNHEWSRLSPPIPAAPLAA
jgi:aspartyl-tRNA(Asn)/glutamyl-tRNA(Gln) amidotransferase subunit A